jgi:hypothetical protein
VGKYVAANPVPLVKLLHNPYQIAALNALAARHCPRCAHQWQVQYGYAETKQCPRCVTIGERDYTRIALVAGRQGGKTRLGTLAVILELSMPESYWWVTAPTYRDLTDFVEPAFFAQIPQRWVDEGDWSASDRILTLPNKSVVAFRSLENPQSMRGPTLDGVLTDEACQVAEMVYPVGNATLAIKRGVWLFTTTPKGRDWVHKQLMLPAERGTPGFWLAKYMSVEAPLFSDAAGKEYLAQQRNQMSPEMYRQEYEATIETFQGAIYGKLLPPCVAEDDQVREWIPEWPRLDPARQALVGLDPGSDHPFAGTVIVPTPHGLVVVGEYLQRERPTKEHAASLKQLVHPLGTRWVCDRSQAQMMIELAQHGIIAAATESGPGSVIAGIERVKTWMLSGQFRIAKSRCPNTIDQLQSYRWADTDHNDGSTGKQEPYKKDDDLCDSLRYDVMAWPHLPVPVAAITTRDLSQMPDKMRQDIERMERRIAQDKQRIADGTGDFYETVQMDSDNQPMYDSEYSDFYA